MAKNRIIGNKDQLPWKLPEDMRHFVKVTTGFPIVMGRKTFESIGKPLKNRTNIILTRDENFKQEGCLVYHDIEKVISDFNKENLMVVGGEEIYRQFLPYADKIYLTFIDQEVEGDTFFPDFEDKNWIKESEERGIKDKSNPYDYYFQVYIKKNE